MSLREIEHHELGLTWVLDEPLARTSHALVDDRRVWLVDPVDDATAMERAAGLGEPQGVIQLLDRHNRDCAAIAQRLGVPHLRLPTAVPDSPFEAFGVVGWPRWKEVALWWPARRALVVAEALGTSKIFAVGPGPVGVHPFLRLVPPNVLAGRDPEHLVVGHGGAVHGPDTGRAIADALHRSRRDIPRALVRLPLAMRG
jgi:hypothetical protein